MLPPGAFSSYMGYDISTVAIGRAKRRASAAALANVGFAACDIARWQGPDSASLIVAEECLYYLSPPVLERFLLRCGRCLAEGGVILAIVHSATKHARTLAVCRRVCLVRDEETLGERVFLTLAPRPAGGAAPVTRP
jgi:SAM-dependent methyltransferase